MANLAPMFAQLNQAIAGNPLATDKGGRLLNMASQSAGGLMGGMLGADPYSFMTQGARKLQGESDLAKLDLTNTDDITKAVDIYNKMGEQEKAMQMATLASQKREKQIKNLEAAGQEATENAQRKRGMQVALERGDYEALDAIKGGILSPQDYMKHLMTTKADVAKAVASRNPNAGAFTADIQSESGETIKMRFNADGTPMAILGKAAANNSLTEMVNPDSGMLEMALVNTDTGETTFLQPSEVQKPDISIQKNASKDGRYDVFADGQLIRTVDSVDEAQAYQKNMDTVYKSGLVKNTIGEAKAVLEEADVAGWGGLMSYLPGTQARKYNNLLESIRANTGFAELRQLKEAGGTLGQVSNIENILLQSTLARLDNLDEKDAQLAALGKIEQHLTNMQRIALGESIVETIDWTAKEYQDIGVQTATDANGKLVVRLPDGTYLE